MSNKESSRRMTMPEAIRIQRETLDRWKLVLIPMVYRELEQWCYQKDEETEDPYEIPRGQTIYEYLENTIMNRLQKELYPNRPVGDIVLPTPGRGM